MLQDHSVIEKYYYNLGVGKTLEHRIKESSFALTTANGQNTRLLLFSKSVPSVGLN